MEETTLRFGLDYIKQKSSYLNSLDSLSIEDYDINKIRLGKGYHLDFDSAAGLFTIESKIDFIYIESEENQVNLFGINVELGFRLHDFEGIVRKVDDNTIDAPDTLVVNLVSIAYSTARGMLFCHTSKSDFEGLYLPLTQPDEFKAALYGERKE